jgi:predicted ATP-grasp superfamily ATP-dependent carboligase
LGAAGVRPVALDRSRLAGGCWSRATAGRARVPDVEVDGAGFGRRVAELCAACGDPPVYAATESTIDALLAAGAGRAFAPGAALAALRAKAGLGELASGTGLRAPRLVARTTTAGLGDLELAAGEEVVVKAAEAAGGLRGIRLAGDAAGLRALAGSLEAGLDLIVQERVAGPQLSLAVVLGRDGGLLAAFQHAVERTWPLDGGVTSLARSEPADPLLVDAVAALLRRAGFWGLAQVDIVAGSDGPVVLDVNTRYYGSMALAVACGVNLPAAWHAAAVERPSAEPSSYRYGLGFWWAEADVRTLHRLRRPPGGHVGPLWQAGDLRAGGLIGAARVLAELRARLR